MAKLTLKDGTTIDIASSSYIGSILTKVSDFDALKALSDLITADNYDAVRDVKITRDDEQETSYTGMTVTDATFHTVDVRDTYIQVELSLRPMTEIELAGESFEIAREYLTDEQAVTVKNIYDKWEDIIGKTVKIGTHFVYNDDLYKTIQDKLLIQEQYIPGEGTESLYVRIDELHRGTLEDPIPWIQNMQPELNKYYIEGDLIAQCIEDPGQPLYHPLSALVGGRYFKAIE